MTAECSVCNVSYYDERDLRKRHYEEYPEHAPKEYESCPDCGKPYKQLACHWRYNPEHRPSFTDKQLNIIKGLLMGDGCLDISSKYPRIKVETINEKYLHELNNIFSLLSSTGGVYQSMDSVESSMNISNSSFIEVKNPDCSDLYTWKTKTHPDLEKFKSWYSSGKKIFPETINLDPEVLKHWYVGDGSYTEYDRFTIVTGNESESKKKINSYFQKKSLPKPKWVTSERYGAKISHLRWTVDESKELFEYIGEPLPGFEYKWPGELQ
jgi:hypothetical protein